MIDLYTWATPNGWKVSATLEELGLQYNVHPIDIMNGAQNEPDYVAINPNARIPTIIDRENDNFTIFESGAIMMYLAEKTNQLIPGDAKGRNKVLQWLMFQIGGLGPMQGQANIFYRYFPEKIPSAIERYQNETMRLYGILDTHLKDREYLVGDFSIADIAHWSWTRIHRWAGLEIEELPHLKRWLGQIEARPACAKGAAVPHATTYHEPDENADEMATAIQSIVMK